MDKGRVQVSRGNGALARFVRGVRPDRNPLRRRWDRMETYLITGAIATAIAAAPFAIPAAAQAASTAGARAQASQEASRHEVTAVLLQPAADAGKTYAPDTQVLAQATWPAPSGASLTGQVLAPAGAAKGSPVQVWTDATGHLTAAPLTDSQIASQADLAGAASGITLALLLLGETALIQQAMNRRRMAAWDAEWSATEPNRAA